MTIRLCWSHYRAEPSSAAADTANFPRTVADTADRADRKLAAARRADHKLANADIACWGPPQLVFDKAGHAD